MSFEMATFQLNFLVVGFWVFCSQNVLGNHFGRRRRTRGGGEKVVYKENRVFVEEKRGVVLTDVFLYCFGGVTWQLQMT